MTTATRAHLPATAWRRLGPALAVVCCLALAVAGMAPPAEAAERVEQRGDIVIRSDADFTPAEGVRSGSGTKKDPYVISNWQVRRLSISDTDRYVVIRDNVVTSRMTLNWNGNRVTVVHNTVEDLRVNENVRRTGAATSGRIAENHFGFVGQLRHFDGVFERNVVGSPASLELPFFNTRAVNFDGFHGARFRDNRIYGYVDVKLHGHHHGSGFDEESHNHAHNGHGSHGDGDETDHSHRYHQVSITGNRIEANGSWALRYYDLAHRADDRTASSEQDPALNKPHVHHTRVNMAGNELVGAGLMVDVFNATDQNHTGTATGLVRIHDIEILLESRTSERFQRLDGIYVRSARDVVVQISNNQIGWSIDSDLLEGAFQSPMGIRLQDLDEGRVYLRRNRVSDVTYGIHAQNFSSSVYWWIEDLKTDGVDRDVYYDSSVSNPPNQGP